MDNNYIFHTYIIRDRVNPKINGIYIFKKMIDNYPTYILKNSKYRIFFNSKNNTWNISNGDMNPIYTSRNVTILKTNGLDLSNRQLWRNSKMTITKVCSICKLKINK